MGTWRRAAGIAGGILIVAACTDLSGLSGEPPGDAGIPPTSGDASATDGGGADAGPDPLDDGLVGHWTFDEGTGVVANDTSGKRNNGALRGGPTWIDAGHSGGALFFDGGAPYAEVLALAGAKFPARGTLSLWVRLNGSATDGNRPIFAGYGPPSAHILVRTLGAGKLQFSGYKVDGGQEFTTLYNAPTDKWTHLVVTWDGSAGTASAYVDGALAATDNVSSAWSPSEQSVVFARHDCCEAIVGDLDEIRLWSRALTPAEIQRIP